MKKETEHQYIKKTQKDYSMAFKLGVVGEVESGELSIKGAHRKYGIQGSHTVQTWLRKYGNFDWENQSMEQKPKSKDQIILEQETRIRLLEKQNARLENQLERTDKKALLLDMLIDLAEEEFKLPIRKNSLPGQSAASVSNKQKKA